MLTNINKNIKKSNIALSTFTDQFVFLDKLISKLDEKQFRSLIDFVYDNF